MKKLFILFLFLFSVPLFSQENYKPSDSLGAKPRNENSISYEDVVYDGNVDQEAIYPGGIEELRKFIALRIEYPEAAIKHKTQGRVLIKFVVEKDGTISNATIEKNIGDGCGEEVIKILKLTSGEWNPSKVNGKPVRSVYRFPVAFRIP